MSSHVATSLSDLSPLPSELRCEILIVGGGAGGVAAAMSACAGGASVILLEETNWLGGQLTTQGVSTPDEQQHIETFGGTSRYNEFRERIREFYRTERILSAEALSSPALNPGSCWVSKLSYEPKVGAEVLKRMLQPYVEQGKLRICFETKATACEMEGATILAVVAESQAKKDSDASLSDEKSTCRITAQFVLDATDLGDLLPMCGKEGVDWITGAESRAETGEPDAPLEPRPHWVQPFTFPFALEWSPETAASNVISPPHDYEELKKLQNYHIKHGAITGLFSGRAPWWSYRRILAAKNFQDPRIKNDVAMINTAGNDYYGGNVIGEGAGSQTEIETTLQRARRASLGYVYWLQRECPRDEPEPVELQTGQTSTSEKLPVPQTKAKGYPEFRLLKEIFDTEDGCSPQPYIRESRRIRSKRPILEQEIVVSDFQGNVCRGERARAAFMPDSVGIGHYALDIHPNGHGEPNHYVPTRPFQIPLGALIPMRLKNYLPACKNFGTTHLTNGAYRLHPIEWNAGESVGALAAFCVSASTLPSEVFDDKARSKSFQALLLREGVPLYWYIDVPYGHPSFEAVQTIALSGLQLSSEIDLLFRPDDPIRLQDWNYWRTVLELPPAEMPPISRAEAALLLQ